MMLHQWHKNYRGRETKELNLELQLSKIVEINNRHLQYNLKIMNPAQTYQNGEQ